MKTLLSEVLASERVLRRRDHHELRRPIDHCLDTGELIAVLPGIYTAPAPDVETLALSAARYQPDCVVVGAAAARLLWWPECAVDQVDIAVRWPSPAWRQYRVEHRVVPSDLIVERGPVRIANPALSVLDLLPALGGRVIDEALRLHAVTLPVLWQALELTVGRRGNLLRRELLLDSRDEPWSEAERAAHRALRAAGITGWVTNHQIEVLGHTYFADIAFPRLRLIVEIDGQEFHNNPEAFIRDRWRWSRMTAAGWRVLVFPASATSEPAEMITLIEATLAAAKLTQRG
ncbi:MAG: DUF559 domain-containing protein [Micropruina sp.]|uniref:endonuclease domain-containing protein n=1 Tax=Micropruina sp. TaxID=2737536 RepID=UPI0039E4237A